MKQPLHAIQLSTFKAPRFQGRAVSVDYLQGFWIRLFWDVIISLVRIRSGRPQLKALNPFGNLSFRRAAFLLLAASLINLYLPKPSHTVYADPIIHSSFIKPAESLKMPSLSPQEPLETLERVLSVAAYGTYANDYAPGNCTFFVASRIQVPNSMGNAINWGYAAASLGYTVSSVPKVGAVAWSVSDSYLGHVAVVEAVNGADVTISEMNYNGLYSVDERLVNPGEFQYIYF